MRNTINNQISYLCASKFLNTHFKRKILMKISFYLLLAVAIFSMGCKPKPYSTTAKGLKYKIYKSNGGEKPKLGDMIKFHYSITTAKDSELSSSYKMGKPYLARLYNTVFGSMTEGFEMLAKGEKFH